ncbi:hypothetical protein HELRODRAFT_97197 [Helobdella robusta]|uniref:Protein kinase domain-containing protein n=1 Tax=Helobdella robusta TaxID=6412 RepID=T1G9F9_HELRO|nr:hypothetical protein HELRODRAFT_97197 [Helobdella robusta]ESO11036.1 hypothetical protein HELRODRAFT_97197 [Helobdella robusta]
MQEIYDYPKIYFVGPSANKLRINQLDDKLSSSKKILVVDMNSSSDNNNNNGFDDDQRAYRHVAHDHIAYRYEVIQMLGKGSFGQVVKAFDHKDRVYTAVKMVRNEKRFHKQAQEEIRILNNLKRLDKDSKHNVVQILDNFIFRNHVCIMFELLSINLYDLLKRNKFQGFGLPLIRKFAYSILLCLNLLYRNRIIHCDLKPENILLKQEGRSSIKVIDFGSSCYENQRIYTYIQSRFYRAPEVILGARYGTPIDMWSFGCILVELLTGRPMFPGEDEADQLACMIEVLGLPPSRMFEDGKRCGQFISSNGVPKYCSVEKNQKTGESVLVGSRSKKGRYRGPPNTRQLSSVLNSSDSNFQQFIRQCFEWDPSERLTPQQALKHPWIRQSPTSGIANRPIVTSRTLNNLKDGKDSKRQSAATTTTTTKSLENNLNRGAEVCREKKTIRNSSGFGKLGNAVMLNNALNSTSRSTNAKHKHIDAVQFS